jgi:hypothetical protein
MPEAVLPMSALCIFLSTAPKSNSALTGYDAARAAVQAQGALPVPLHLRDGHSAAARALGYGSGYKYPHDYPGHYVAQRYLPTELEAEPADGRAEVPSSEDAPDDGDGDGDGVFGPFYRPSQSGHERSISERLTQIRQIRRPLKAS